MQYLKIQKSIEIFNLKIKKIKVCRSIKLTWNAPQNNHMHDDGVS